MKKTSFVQYLKLVIPVTALILVLVSKFTVLGQWISMEDVIIFMLCGLTALTGIDTYKKQPSIGFFLIGSSLLIVVLRLLIIFRP